WCLKKLPGWTVGRIVTVESLVREWAPLVWLAPGEKFLPSAVTDFLHHVHAEKSRAKEKIKAPPPPPTPELELSDNNIRRNGHDAWEKRNKRTFRGENLLVDYIIDMPVGENSENWFLVTNDDIEDLLDNDVSFIYGQMPNHGSVPIYALVSLCPDPPPGHSDGKVEFKTNPYIPLQKPQPIENLNYFTSQDAIPSYKVLDNHLDGRTKAQKRRKREVAVVMAQSVHGNTSTYGAPEVMNELAEEAPKVENISKVVEKDEEWSVPVNVPLHTPYKDHRDVDYYANYVQNDDFQQQQKVNIPNGKIKDKEVTYPHLFVTYWMFYPYNQGKTICSISLGPFGHLPIPLFFGMCFGTRRDFGSHVGDWEHMSLYFRGRREPDEMYVSAHDAGAYYEYDRLTGTFEFKRQETRVGILQKPVFPRTVVTSANHPVLFAAKGSHGLWTAPGKHRFIRVPRLYDVNGFGIPWSTWVNTEILYEDEISARSAFHQPHWIQFKGRWGNPKSKCHPLKRIGLNFCEYSDGPMGIRRKPHFHCTN
uniref:Vacuolar protein sorting-associated protein 62 n=1 Tax=Lutzomyia longipalpis TaxID=7200 RepID=A0A1B0CV26_LUTLO